MQRRQIIGRIAAAGFALCAALPAIAQDTLKVGLILPMTGPFASTGRQIDAAVKLYLAQHGDKVAGKTVEVLLKDDGGVADQTRRIAQELIVRDKVVALAGFGLTPLAFATAPLATQSKTPMVVMAAATASVTERSPYIVRTSFTLPQVTVPIAEWASKNGIKKVVTLVSDYAPGIDAEKAFIDRFTLNGGTIATQLRVPMANPDFAPFLQRVQDAKPDAVFVFVPSGIGAAFMKQFSERGLDKAGIKIIGPGDVVDDDILNGMGGVALGVVTSGHYSAAHPSALNKKYVAGMAKTGQRANFHSVGGYDGMRVIMEGLKASKGQGGDALLAAMKGQTFESPRGPVYIDAQTRETVQDVYIRKVERGAGGELWNIEFDVIKGVKDPTHKSK